MKKQLIALLLVAYFCIGQLSAQDKDSVTTLPTVTVTSGVAITKDVDKAFYKAFPGAYDLRWYKLNKDYLAKFIKDDMDHNALFAKNGYLKYDISYGYQNHLPQDIKDKVLGAYLDHKISRVANVKEEGRNIWVITLESLKRIILVRVEEGEMEEVQNFEKSM